MDRVYSWSAAIRLTPSLCIPSLFFPGLRSSPINLGTPVIVPLPFISVHPSLRLFQHKITPPIMTAHAQPRTNRSTATTAAAAALVVAATTFASLAPLAQAATAGGTYPSLASYAGSNFFDGFTFSGGYDNTTNGVSCPTLAVSPFFFFLFSFWERKPGRCFKWVKHGAWGSERRAEGVRSLTCLARWGLGA